MKLGDKVYKGIDAVVTRVIDGDTIEVTVDCLFDIAQKNLQVRLYGIDTPELSSTKVEIRTAAKAAKVRLTDLLQGKSVKLTSYKVIDDDLDTDKYGRYLADVYLEDKNINQLMIQEGYAKEYFGGKK